MDQMRPVFGFAKSVFKFALPFFVIGVVFLAFGLWIWSVLPFILTLYIFYFFRDPERKTPGIPNSLCSPADGKVASVMEVPCEEMPGGRALRIAIFLNIFNVHVQRAPITGVVTSVKQRAGKKLNALNEKCSEENEAVSIWMNTDFGPVGVRQIAGAIARRVICKAGVNTKLERGDRYGIIQFGSRVELFLPLTATAKVTPGQHVTGAITCVAVMEEAKVLKGQDKNKSGDTAKKLVVD